MAKYEFTILMLDRVELRSNGPASDELNALGSQGWRIVHVREDWGSERHLAFILERETP